MKTIVDLINSLERYLLGITVNGLPLFENVVPGASDADILSYAQNSKGGAFFQVTPGQRKSFSSSDSPVILLNTKVRIAILSCRSKQTPKTFIQQAKERLEHFLNYYQNNPTVPSQSNAGEFYTLRLADLPAEPIVTDYGIVIIVNMRIDKIQLS